jgi:hypothetical protein
VGPRAGLDAVEKRKILPCQESNLGPEKDNRNKDNWALKGPLSKGRVSLRNSGFMNQ